MFKPGYKKSFFALLIATLTIAFVAARFGHRFLTEKELELQAYVQLFGDQAELCEDSSGDMKHSSDCDSCRLISAFTLPAPEVDFRSADLIFVARVILPAMRKADALAAFSQHPTRAPPLV